MCGIAGALGRLDAAALAAVARMNDAQAHRGPDAQGMWSASTGAAGDALGVALAHRRLAIIDLSPDSNQPMTDADAGNVIVFNGEIYNYRELRDELSAGGARFRTQGDTEVILKAYAAWGDACVSRLRGMFAFALWDPKRRRLLLARDRLGIKPLFYTVRPGPDGSPLLLFASEVRALLSSGLVERKLDPDALATYFWNGFVVGPHAIIRGVMLLPGGSFASVSPDKPVVTVESYWRLSGHGINGSNGSNGRAHDEGLREELARATRQHLVSDVPLGVFLSGGVDSSAVAALAVEQAGQRVKTFNLSFDEAEYDESPYARAVAGALGTEHIEVRLGEAAFADHLEDALESIDQPTFDGINTYYISRAVRDAGLTVALAGTGGDELFGGYTSFRDIPRVAAWGRNLAWVPDGAVRAAAKAVTRWKMGRSGAAPPQTRWAKLGDALTAHGSLLELYQLGYALFTPDFYRLLVGADGVRGRAAYGLTPGRTAELRDLIGSASPRQAISILELSCFLGERLLRDTDAASMAASIEVRVPLLDHGVVEAAMALDEPERFDPVGRKQALRQAALGNLDPAIFDRPKSGFVLPIDTWCRRRIRGEVGALLTDAAACISVGLNPGAVANLWAAFEAGAPGIYWSRVWALFVLLWWCRRHGVTV